MRDGFPLSKRVDSLKRHIDESHQKLWHEDAIAHLIWNFMAIYHVLKVMPEKNDLLQYEGKWVESYLIHTYASLWIFMDLY